jgi:hypothetical protein
MIENKSKLIIMNSLDGLNSPTIHHTISEKSENIDASDM